MYFSNPDTTPTQASFVNTPEVTAVYVVAVNMGLFSEYRPHYLHKMKKTA